ncbi:MAG: FAD-dependent oxidoreductase [Pirellulaceae bacterium]
MNWTELADLSGPPRSEGFGWIARGFWKRDGELLALASHFNAPGYDGLGLSLEAFRWDGVKWVAYGTVLDDSMNNFPPKRLPTGEWMMTRRDHKRQVSVMIGGTKAFDDWHIHPLAAYNGNGRPEEPYWYLLPDGKTIVGLIRDNEGSKFLLRTFSRNNGQTWSDIHRTNFPDATSKFFVHRTSRGYYAMVSNSNPRQRDPLTLAISQDGLLFTKLLWLIGGRHVDYPHMIEHEGHLLLAFSGAKQTMEVMKVSLDELERLTMPASVELTQHPSPARRIAWEGAQADVIVYGGTPGGLAAAVAAARLGNRVIVVEPNLHVGGMTSSGLGKSDIENRAMIGGIFLEFTQAQLQHYLDTYGPEHDNVALCHDGYYAEPSVSEAVFEAMLAAEGERITVLKGWRLADARTSDNTLRSIMIQQKRDGVSRELRGKVFIDATYEGDLYAAAGAEYRLGREPRDEFNEAHAGVIYFDYQEKEFLPGTTGEVSSDLPAFTYRLCLTNDPRNSHQLSEPPPGYDRSNYLSYFDDLRAGRLAGPKVLKPGRGYDPKHFNTLVRALSVTNIPNNKTDVNMNPRPLGFPFAEENRGYIEGNEATRDEIRERIRNLTLGLIWFLQHDAEVPEEHRKLANELHFPNDEFMDDEQHFPFQLYVREGRRLIGEITLTEHHITGKDVAITHHPDTIAIGEFPIDSFPCRKRQPSDTVVLEGYLGMLDHITRPYEIPYRIMIPKRIDGIIVPVAASTTHVAYSSIRMEPTWMALGQAAGTAAHLAIERKVQLRDVPIQLLQTTLRNNGQVLSW